MASSIPSIAALSTAIRRSTSDVALSSLFPTLKNKSDSEDTLNNTSNLSLTSLLNEPKVSFADDLEDFDQPSNSFEQILKSFQSTLAEPGFDLEMINEVKRVQEAEDLPLMGNATCGKVSFNLGADDDLSTSSLYSHEYSDWEQSSVAQNSTPPRSPSQTFEPALTVGSSDILAQLEASLGAPSTSVVDGTRARSDSMSLDFSDLLMLDSQPEQVPPASPVTKRAHRTLGNPSKTATSYRQPLTQAALETSSSRQAMTEKEKRHREKELKLRQEHLQKHLKTGQTVMSDMLQVMHRLWMDGKLNGI